MLNEINKKHREEMEKFKEDSILKFQSFLDGLDKSKKNENEIQRYLEANTELIPTPIILNHSLHFNVMYSKFELDNLKSDFLYITKSSAHWNVVLIELEDSNKKIFTNSLEQIHFSSEFNNSIDQISGWKSEIEKGKEKVVQGIECLLGNGTMRKNPIIFKYVLIIGRTEKTYSDRHFQLLSQKSRESDITIMTYDSIISYIQEAPYIYKKILISKWLQGIKIKFADSTFTTMFAYINPSYLKLEDPERQKFIDEGYEIEKWENGEMLSFNLKFTKMPAKK